MSRIVASYDVKITLREPEDDDQVAQDPPTIDELETTLADAIDGFLVHVEATRTDE